MKYLFFDCETTGVPFKGADYKTDFKFFPYPVQIAWQLVDDDQKILNKQCHIIKPVDWEIPQETTDIHGISTEEALKNGQDMQTVLTCFIADAKNADKLIAHNIFFDTSIIKANLLRLGIEPERVNEALDKAKRTCTMMKTTKYVGMVWEDSNRLKWPKLEELYWKLFRETFSNKHSADIDVEAVKRCYFELIKLEIL